MLLKTNNLQLVTGLIGLALVIGAGAVWAGPSAPEKIEMSEPSAPMAVSNLDRVGTIKLPFPTPQNDFWKNWQGASSMNPLTAPIRPAPQLTPQQREAIEERKNWAFVGSDTLVPKTSAEDMLQVKHYGDDGLEKKALGPVEKFLDQQKTRGNQSAAAMMYSLGVGQNRDFAGTNAYNPDSLAMGTNGYIPWSSLSSDSMNASLPSWAGGPAQTLTSAEQSRALLHRTEFNRLLNGPAVTAPGASGFSTGFSGAPGFPSPGGSSPGFAQNSGVSDALIPGAPLPTRPPVAEYRNSANPILGAALQLPTIHSAAFDDPTRRALGLPQLEPKHVADDQPKPKQHPDTFQFTVPSRGF